MKSVIALAFAGLVATISAQDISNLPPCALTCLTSGLSATSCSNIADIECACTDEAFIASTGTCIQTSCTTPADQQRAIAGAAAICSSAGVTIPTTLPSSSAVSSSSATISEAPTTGGSTESFPTIIDSTTAVTLTTTTSTTSVVPTGNVTATSSAPPMQSTNAGTRLGNMGGLAAMGLGLVAYLAV